MKCRLDLNKTLIGYKKRFCIFSVKETKPLRKGLNKSSKVGRYHLISTWKPSRFSLELGRRGSSQAAALSPLCCCVSRRASFPAGTARHQPMHQRTPVAGDPKLLAW